MSYYLNFSVWYACFHFLRELRLLYAPLIFYIIYNGINLPSMLVSNTMFSKRRLNTVAVTTFNQSQAIKRLTSNSGWPSAARILTIALSTCIVFSFCLIVVVVYCATRQPFRNKAFMDFTSNYRVPVVWWVQVYLVTWSQNLCLHSCSSF